eukprot:10810_1
MTWYSLLIILLTKYACCVEFNSKCSANLTHHHYGYNITCTFNITVLTDAIYHVSLNWSVPSQSSFVFDNQTHFIGGESPVNVYHKTPLIATWYGINASSTAIVVLHLTPNASITNNEAVISTAFLQYYNVSNLSLATSASSISKSVLIQFTTPSNDGPYLSASSYSLSTIEDTPVSTNVYVTDPDFYELSADGLMSVNISVINGTLSLSTELGGIHFLNGNGHNSSDIHMVGSLRSVNQSLHVITFMPRKNMAGHGQVIISLSDDGNTGTGAAHTASIIININISQIYEIPNIMAPSAKITILEDTALNLAQVNCSVTADVDPHYGWLQLHIAAIYGNFSFDGGTLPNRTYFGAHSITINDTSQLLSSYLQNITYYPVENFNEESDDIETISLELTDHADLQQSKHFDVVIESVNDAPTVSIASSFETNEDTVKDITITVEDIDCDVTWGATLYVILSVSNGTLSLNSRKGLLIATGAWQSSKAIEFTASKTNVNDALNPVTYQPLLNYFGNDSLEIAVSDRGNTGEYGGIQWSNTSIPITVNEANGDDMVPIINGFSTPITCFEDIECSISNVSLHIANTAKQGNTNFTIHIAITHQMGFISLNQDALDRVQFTLGNGTLDTMVEFKGNYSSINDALHNMSFVSTLNNHGYQGEIQLNATNDFGDTFTMINNLYIDAVNDAPIIHTPYSSITIDEDQSLQIVGITLEDVDINDTWYGHFYCNISCLHATIQLHSHEGIQFIGSTADESNRIHMFSRAGLIEIALSTLQYTPDSHYVGTDVITIDVHDDGNTGSGGVLHDTQTITITIDNVLDPPIPLCLERSLFGVEDTPLHITGVRLLDTDNVTLNDSDHSIYIRFTLNHGTILNMTTIYSVDESVDSFSWQGLLHGSYADINEILANITYIPVLNYNKVCCGHEKLLITASYNSTMTGLIGECAMDIYISSVNDAPAIYVETEQMVMEDATLALGIEVNDVDVTEDASNGLFHVSLYASHGTIDCDLWAGSWIKNGSIGSDYVEIVGSTPHVMDTVRTCKFNPLADFTGNTTVLVRAWDNGLSGETEILHNVKALISINVTSVPDAPRVFLQDANYTQSYQLYTNEDSNLTMNFTVWEVDSDLNGSVFTFSSTFGTISGKDIDPLRWYTATDGNGSFIAQCIGCEGLTHQDLSVEYTPHLHANSKRFGNETIHIETQDVDGSIDDVYYSMTVHAINDPIVLSCPASVLFGYEDIPIALNVSAYDPDWDGGWLSISILSSNGTFYFDFESTPPFVQHEGDMTRNSSRLIGESTLHGLNIMLRDLRFMSDPNYYGNASIDITVSDEGYESNCTQHMVLSPVNDAIIVSDALDYIIDIAEDMESFITGMRLIDNDTTNDYLYSVVIEFESEMHTRYSMTHLNYSAIQSLIGNISVSPVPHYNGYMQMGVHITSNDTLQTNEQYAISKASLFHILHVHAVNDAPIIDVAPSNLSIDEDACGSIQINITDLDFDEFQENQVRTKYMTGWLSAVNCTFSIANYYGLNYIEGEPLESSFFKFHCGSLEVVNGALSQIQICSSIDDFYGNAVLYFNVSDNAYSHGNTSVFGVSDAPLSDQISVAIAIHPVIDFVEIIMNSSYNGSEDTRVPFAIDIDTPDRIKPDLEIRITSRFGNISTSTNCSTTNCMETFHALDVVGNWSLCSEVVSNLVYLADVNWNGYDDDLHVIANISATGQSTSNTATMYIAAVNDPITISYSSLNYTVFEDESLRIDGISIHDLDHPSQLITATVNCSGGHGYVSLSTFDGLEYVQGNGGTMDTVIQVKGGFEHVRHALESDIRFEPYHDWFGDTRITLIVSDEGFTDVLTIQITVISTPDRPTFAIGSDTQCDEDTLCFISGGNVSDSDSDEFQIAISVDSGVLTLDSVFGLSFTTGNGSNDRQMMFNGTAQNVNAAISNMTYQANMHYNGHDTVTMSCTDFDTAMLSHVLDVDVVAVNDAPHITIGSETFYAFDSVPIAIRDVSISDVDETKHALCECNISARNGSVYLGALESANRWRDSGSIHLLTDLKQLNQALSQHLMYTSAPYFEGIDIITIAVDDLGNTGDGAPLSDTQTINISVSGVNHEPILTKSVQMIELKQHQTASFNVSVHDEDCARHPDIMCNLTLSIQTHEGSIMSSNCPALTANTFGKQLIMNGNVSDINECVTNLTFVVVSNWNGIKGHEIEISLRDDAFYVTDVIAVNVSRINHELRIINTDSTASYVVKNGYSVALNTLQVQDMDLNVTNTELVLVNISVDYNTIALYAVNGLHFNQRFRRTNRYSTLDFYATIYSINQALPYLYFHSNGNASLCGTDTVQIVVSYESETANASLSVNVTC